MRLQLNTLTVRYGKLVALRDVTASADGGKIVCVLGPNASGKSTLLRSIAGLQTPTRGNILFDGASLTKLHPKERAAKVAWVPRTSDVGGRFTLRRIVELGRYALGPSPTRVEDALATVDLLERAETLWHEASAGMKQRAAIARALAQRTPGGLFVLDEPTSALDLKHVKIVCDILRACACEGDLVVFAVHDLSMAINLSDTAFVLRRGELALAGQSQAILNPGSLGEVFGVDLAWATDEAGKRHLISP
ncbi:MAG: ABC transporter ATP-binding protein [Phycisphaerales bacterium]|jgi:iron complex transport system ATP-binding protein|nr:ABC transporter ATP-binding protein [Phycisphaerales bacterium]